MKVVLSGQGSDEVLAGYAHLIADHHAIKAARGESEDVDVDRAHTTSRGLHLPVGELVDVSALQKALGFVPTWLSARAATALRLRSLAAPEFIARFAGRDPYRVFLNNFPIAKPGARMSLRQSQYLWNRSIFLHYMLAAFDDKMDMANSVEARNPYLDPAVVEYGFGLPDSLKVRGVYSKYVLRQAVRELLPSSSSGTLKKPFLAPPLGGKKAGRFTELLKDTLSGAEARDCEFIDFQAVRSMLDRLPQMSADETGLWSPVLTIALSLVLMSSFSKSDYALQPKPARFGVGANAG
jgi:asparagine synthase (glutamine-hydrolysing)